MHICIHDKLEDSVQFFRVIFLLSFVCIIPIYRQSIHYFHLILDKNMHSPALHIYTHYTLIVCIENFKI